VQVQLRPPHADFRRPLLEQRADLALKPFFEIPYQGDPEMHQTKKGNQWYFGMKVHIRVASRTKLIHSVAATAATVLDSQVLLELLHGQETRVWGDAAYSEQRDVIQHHAPRAKCFIHTPKPIAIGP